MRTAIEVVWWIGLLGALPATFVIVKEALLVVATLRRIHQLAERTRVAAQGIVVHMEPVPKLEGAGNIVKGIDDAIGDVAKALSGVARRLGDRA